MNFIYFNPDEMRADLLGCYGHELAQTPNFDRFAAEGVRFDQCHVQHTVCAPSRASFLTGWYPHVRGHRTLWHPLQGDEPNTFRYLKEAGYDVFVSGKNDAFSAAAQELSVTGRIAAEIELVTPVGEAPEKRLFQNFLHQPYEGHHEDYYKTRAVIAKLRELKDSPTPFMIFMAHEYPHCPYTCPREYYNMYDPADLPPLRPADLEGKPALYSAIRKHRELYHLGEDDFTKIMAVYLGMISYVDAQFGLLLDALEETGLDKTTAVFFFSDHGDWAGDYGLVEKWPSALDDCLTRVPMIVRSPGCRAGHVVREPVECFDIMPTTLELAGIEAGHTHFARSMVPQLNGAAGDKDRFVFAEGGYNTNEPHCFEGNDDFDSGLSLLDVPDHVYHKKAVQQQEAPQTVSRSVMIRSLDHKLVERPDGTSEFYDLNKDPQELVNRYHDPACQEGISRCQKELMRWYIRTSDVVPFAKDPRGWK